MDDEKILELFFERSQLAIEELDAKYGRLLRKFSFNILGSTADAEECVNDSYLGAWNAIPPARPNPLLAYLCKIVRNISLRRYYNNRKAERNSVFEVTLDEIGEIVSGENTAEKASETKELSMAIGTFLDSLTKENRVIFMRRYAFCDSYKDIGALMNLSEKNVSVRLVRIRKELKNYLERNELL